MKWFVLMSVVAIAAASIACGDPLSTAEETQTAVAGAGTVVPGATGTTAPEGSPTGGQPPSPPPVTTFAPATPAFITPISTATVGVRTDCPPGFEPFADISGLLSLCALADAIAVSDIDGNGTPRINVGSELGGRTAPGVPQFSVAAGISRSPSFPEPLDDACRAAFPGGVAVELQIGSLVASGCQAQTEDHAAAGPLVEMHLSAELLAAEGGSARFLNISVGWRTQSAGAEALARQIAASLRVAS